MSTRSRIAILNSDNSIRMIYCHSDGYLDYNGRILLNHYTDAAKVAELIDLGDISSLGEEIGVKHPFAPDWQNYDAYKAQYGKMTRAYGRDREETGIEARTFPSLDAIPADYFEEFFYLFTPTGWQWFPGEAKGYLAPLTQKDIDGGGDE